jgi:hypothetical protein
MHQIKEVKHEKNKAKKEQIILKIPKIRQLTL